MVPKAERDRLGPSVDPRHPDRPAECPQFGEPQKVFHLGRGRPEPVAEFLAQGHDLLQVRDAGQPDIKVEPHLSLRDVGDGQ